MARRVRKRVDVIESSVADLCAQFAALPAALATAQGSRSGARLWQATDQERAGVAAAAAARLAIDENTGGEYPRWKWRLDERLRRGLLEMEDRLWLEPDLLMDNAGLHPDLWQREVLRAAVRRILLLCARQVGKSTGAAALALKVAVLEAPATVLIFAPSLRQAVELLRTVRNLHRVLTNPTLLPSRITPWADAQRLEDRRERKAERWYLSIPAQKRENALQMTLDNGSRIISLPASYKTTVGYAAINLLIIDEAARVSDELYHSLTPMLSVARGRVLALSTPFGKRGWFYEAHEDEKADWLRIHVHARDCPRHSARFLEEEERSMGPRWFRQEYCLSFEAMVGAVFDYDAIAEAFQCDAEPLVF